MTRALLLLRRNKESTPTMEITFSGKPLQGQTDPTAQAIVVWCKSRPNGKVFSVNEVAAGVNRSPAHVKMNVTCPEVQPYRTAAHKNRRWTMFYGNARTIAALKKQIAGE